MATVKILVRLDIDHLRWPCKENMRERKKTFFSSVARDSGQSDGMVAVRAVRDFLLSHPICHHSSYTSLRVYPTL